MPAPAQQVMPAPAQRVMPAPAQQVMPAPAQQVMFVPAQQVINLRMPANACQLIPVFGIMLQSLKLPPGSEYFLAYTA